MQINKAKRTAAHLLISNGGMSGSGKTLSSLLMARGMVGPEGKIGVIDTESGRASLYESEVPGGFDVINLDPPYTPERYIEALRTFEAARYSVVVIDSASHEWAGTGGVLEMADSNGKKAQLKWLAPKTAHRKFVNALMHTKAHVILCLRAKERFKQVHNDKTGRDDIVSDGWYETAEKDFIYEMTISAMLQDGGYPSLHKCPGFLAGAFSEGQRIGIETGQRLVQLLGPQAAIDWDLDDLRREGTEAAEGGVAALTAWWKSLGAAKQGKARDLVVGTLRPIAEEADRISQEVAQSTQEDQDLSDPFG